MGFLCSNQNPRDKSKTLVTEGGEGQRSKHVSALSAQTAVTDPHFPAAGKEAGLGRVMWVDFECARGRGATLMRGTEVLRGGDSRVWAVNPAADIGSQGTAK